MATTSTVRKVTYIKINKIDEYGNDNTLSLQELTSLRIVFSDLGIVNFPIATITEYPTYYLYSTNEILPNNATSSIDNNVLDYRFSASLSSTSLPFGSLWSGSGLVSSIDARSYFNSTEGNYLFGDTPNIPIQFTASFTFVSSMNGNIGLYDFSSNNYIEILSAAFTNTTYTISASFYPTENSTYGLLIENEDVVGSVTINNIQWKFTQSIAPSSSTNITVLEPYLTKNFEYSDCNVLLNNATNLEYDPNFYKVNYDTGLLVPTNQQQILNRTAEFAPVKPYNYSLNAQVLPRYVGTRYSSDGVNNPSTTNVKLILAYDNINYGTFTNKNTAPVKNLKTALAYIDWWGGWPPEKMDASGAHIKYIIDENGETITPNVTNYSLYANQGTFISNETVSVTNTNQITPTSATRNIFRGATRIEPILYNQLRHYEDGPMTFTGSIRFTDNNPNSSAVIQDFTAEIQPSGSSRKIESSIFSGIFLDEIIDQGANIGTALDNVNRYTITQALIDEISINSITLTATINVITYEPNPPGIYLYAVLYKNESGNSTQITSGNDSVFLPYNTTKTFTFSKTIPRADWVVGQEYGISLRTNYLSNSTYYWGSGVSVPTSLIVSTTPVASPPISTSNLFISSSNANSSSFLFITNSIVTQYYRSSQFIQQVDLSGSLFNSISSNFKFKNGDEFRFEGDESKVFMIKKVNENAYYYPSPSVSQSAVEIELNRQISGLGINISEFLVRRYVDDASMILLDGFQPENSTGPYILKPEFTTTQLNNNINTYIENLTEKGLL